MLRSDLKLAAKVLLRRKFFTAVSLFGVSFTLAILMVATALVDHIFAPHSPETNQRRTLGVFQTELRGPEGGRTGPASYRFLDRNARTLEGAEAVAVFRVQQPVSIWRDGRRLDLFVKLADGEFWRVFDFRFVEGGPYSVLDDRNDRSVAVINESTRDRLFGDRSALGESIDIDGRVYRIGGVVENVPFIRFMPFADVWIPIGSASEARSEDPVSGPFMAVILARSTDDFPALRREFAGRVSEMPIPQGYDRLNAGLDTMFEFFTRAIFREPRPGTMRVVGIVLALLFMALPAVNLVNINLSRILERAPEIGVRKAFGASRGRLVRQFLIENMTLTLIGGAIGLIGAWLILAGINASGLIPYADLSLNLRIFAQAVIVALTFGFLSGVVPAWRMSRLHPVTAIRGAVR